MGSYLKFIFSSASGAYLDCEKVKDVQSDWPF